MPSCRDCHKFVSLETENDVEESEVSLEKGTASLRLRIHNDCVECGTELKAAEFEFEHVFNLEHEHADDEEPDFELFYEVVRTSRSHPPRARRHKTFYGVEGTAFARCTCGYETPEWKFSDEVQASGMDDA